mgnify:CR=1 FL=1
MTAYLAYSIYSYMASFASWRIEKIYKEQTNKIHFKIGKKTSCGNCSNCCPDCEGVLNRIRRTQSDQFIHHFTFRIFDARRYVCHNCGWEGLRWEDQFRPGRD